MLYPHRKRSGNPRMRLFLLRTQPGDRGRRRSDDLSPRLRRRPALECARWPPRTMRSSIAGCRARGLGMSDSVEIRIAVVGLGYVGLPLAVAFGQRHETIGYDIDDARVARLQTGQDDNGEADVHEIAAASRLRFVANAAELRTCNVFVVTVPTPVDEHKRPDFR